MKALHAAVAALSKSERSALTKITERAKPLLDEERRLSSDLDEVGHRPMEWLRSKRARQKFAETGDEGALGEIDVSLPRDVIIARAQQMRSTIKGRLRTIRASLQTLAGEAAGIVAQKLHTVADEHVSNGREFCQRWGAPEEVSPAARFIKHTALACECLAEGRPGGFQKIDGRAEQVYPIDPRAILGAIAK
jgi:hypothetical protein